MTGLRAEAGPEMVTGIVIHSDAPMTVRLVLNPMLNQLTATSGATLQLSGDSLLTAVPWWWTVIRRSSFAFGCPVSSGRVVRKWNIDLMDTQNGAGTFGNQAPVFHGHGSPGWACRRDLPLDDLLHLRRFSYDRATL